MVISLFNILVLIISKRSEEDNYTKFSSVLMILLNLIIISSSFLRMYMYEAHYGYTLLRLLVYLTLATEVLLLFPTICYIFNSKVKILKHYIIIVVSMYTLFNLLPVDYIIAYRNINRYYETDKLDIYYLENNYTDNISLLLKLYYRTDDKKIKYDLESYFREVSYNEKINNIFEYNISKDKAIEDLKNNNL